MEAMTATPPPLREVVAWLVREGHPHLDEGVAAILASAEITALQQRVAALEAGLQQIAERNPDPDAWIEYSLDAVDPLHSALNWYEWAAHAARALLAPEPAP